MAFGNARQGLWRLHGHPEQKLQQVILQDILDGAKIIEVSVNLSHGLWHGAQGHWWFHGQPKHRLQQVNLYGILDDAKAIEVAAKLSRVFGMARKASGGFMANQSTDCSK